MNPASARSVPPDLIVEATRNVLRVLSACVLFGACATSSAPDGEAGSSAGAIVGGMPSGPEQDAVVLVVHHVPGSTSYEVCSGTMLTPKLVLTARHCVAATDPTAACRPDGTPIAGGLIHGDFDPEDIFVFGSRVRPPLSSVVMQAVSGSAIIDDGAGTLCNHDVALVLLESDVPDVKIAPIRLDGGPATAEDVTLVGWGVTDGTSLPLTRQQRVGQSVLVVGPHAVPALGPNEFAIGEGTCEGDSGGPALADDGAVLGLLSRGGNGSVRPGAAGCTGGVNIFSSAAAFKDLILSAYAQAGQVPWLEGQPNPTLAPAAPCGAGCPPGFACDESQRCVSSGSTAESRATSGGGGCSTSRGTSESGCGGAAITTILVILALLIARTVRSRRSCTGGSTPPKDALYGAPQQRRVPLLREVLPCNSHRLRLLPLPRSLTPPRSASSVSRLAAHRSCPSRSA